MADKQHFQHLTVVLKSGRAFELDFGADDSGKVAPQIKNLIDCLGNPQAQDKVILFQGQRIVGFRISEVAGYEVIPLVATPKAPKAEEKKEQEKGEKA